MGNSVSGKSWAFIRLEGDRKQGGGLYQMAARISRAPEEIFVKYYYQKVQKIAFEARRIILNTIDESVTAKGIARARNGGKSGREVSGKMKKGVWARAYKASANRYRAEVGWLDGRPGYAIFQEHGTRNGIVAMDSLRKAGDYIEAEMDKLGRGGYKYRRDTNWDWSQNAGNGNDLGGAPDWFVGK